YCTCGVCTVGRVRDNHFGTVMVAVRFMESFDHHQRSPLSLGTGSGCSVISSMPVISFRCSCISWTISSEPWIALSFCSGWLFAKPGILATFSLILGLYFIVNEPSG